MDYASRSAGDWFAPRRARVLLLATLVVTVALVAITFSPWRSGFADAADRGPGDVALYRAEVARVQAGQQYYDAAGFELRSRGYPTASVFNWRTPLPMVLIAWLPSINAANVLLGAIAFAVICLSFEWLANEAGTRQALLGAVLLVGALLPCVLGELVVMSELWSGTLIALSAAAFGCKRPGIGVAAGVTALFFRELAAPYCLVCLALAARDRQFRELRWWGAGLAAYTVFFAVHVANVLPRAGGQELASVHSWIKFGGAPFLIATAQMNAFLLLLPQAVTAVYLAWVWLSAATWTSPAGRRVGLTIAVYAVAFCVAGNDYNQYWGSMIAPLYALAAGRVPGALRQLILEAGWWPRAVRQQWRPRRAY